MFLPSSCRRSRRHAPWLLVAVALLSVTPAPSETGSLPADARGPASSPAAIAPKPIFLPGFSSVDRWHLAAAFDMAIRELARKEGCRALFDGLELEALEALAGTLYEPARGAVAAARCRGPVVALTMVNGNRTRLCEAFQRLSRNEKASTLIHEALHRAGVRESPPDREAPTAREIKEMVNSACGL